MLGGGCAVLIGGYGDAALLLCWYFDLTFVWFLASESQREESHHVHALFRNSDERGVVGRSGAPYVVHNLVRVYLP